MSKRVNGKQSVTACIDKAQSFDVGSWLFCQNGYQSTGVDISFEQFEMMRELVNDPEVVEFYESLRS